MEKEYLQPKRKGLGRGLAALFDDEEDKVQAAPVAVGSANHRIVAIEMLEPNPSQPRRFFSEESLRELADSIKEHGVLQALLVRPKEGTQGRYQIIAGERRWRASQKAGLHELPVHIQEMSDGKVLEVALVENLQRSDLNPLEEAEGYKRLIDQYGHTQEKVAELVSKSRSHVANMVRLLTLPPGVQVLLRSGKLSGGHARALITAKDPDALARQVIAEDLSVRDTEKLAAEAAGRSAPGKSSSKKGAPKDVDTLALENEITKALGMRVVIDVKGQGGQLHVEFKSLDQLDEITHRLSRSAR